MLDKSFRRNLKIAIKLIEKNIMFDGNYRILTVAQLTVRNQDDDHLDKRGRTINIQTGSNCVKPII